ncbi:hypothetical protein VTJ83DRAFT_3123 [Remersonia thermophila]|uniref:AB hydrolase-1 domain-containing protein n=1 Tax=Remersonia thermophila TaxID=72144 RepID=A0ABR4DFB9_9PEZI
MSRFFRVVKHTLPCAHGREYATATLNGDVDRPQLVVKQYIPLDNPNPQPGDITIIGGHANGFPKELYEPLWDEIHQRASKSGFRIRSIWIADMWNQGESGVLNEAIMGNDPSWWDHTRDLAHLINTKRDEMPQPIVGVGHSMGACQLALLSLCHPRLLRALVLLDPVITIANTGFDPAVASTKRRDLWESRAAAVAKFSQSPFYKRWDRRVFDLWVEHGLRDLPTAVYPDAAAHPGAVTLTTTKHQELFTFLRPTYRGEELPGGLADRDPSVYRDEMPDSAMEGAHDVYPFYRPEPAVAFGRLPELRPGVLYVFGGDSEVSPPSERKKKMERTGTGVGGSGGASKGRVHEVVLQGCGHLVAMERVGDCADAAAGFLAREIQLWRDEQNRFAEIRKGKDKREVAMIDEQWKKKITPRPRAKGKL